MNTYYFRANSADWHKLFLAAKSLGIFIEYTQAGIELLLGDQWIQQPPEFKYQYITNYPTWVWVYVGPKMIGTGEFVELEDVGQVEKTTPLKDAESNILYHANLYSDIDLKTYAQEHINRDPQNIGYVLKNLHRFILVDEDGNPRAPTNPMMKLAGE